VAARRGRVAVSITADNSGAEEGRQGERARSRPPATRRRQQHARPVGRVQGRRRDHRRRRRRRPDPPDRRRRPRGEVSQKRSCRAAQGVCGISYRAHAAEIDRVIQKTSQLAGLDDEDLQDAFTNIVRVTGNVNKSLQRRARGGLRRAKHMDVAKAGEIVGKVAGGNTGILSAGTASRSARAPPRPRRSASCRPSSPGRPRRTARRQPARRTGSASPSRTSAKPSARSSSRS
jgi:hypothetical protein